MGAKAFAAKHLRIPRAREKASGYGRDLPRQEGLVVKDVKVTLRNLI